MNDNMTIKKLYESLKPIVEDFGDLEVRVSYDTILVSQLQLLKIEHQEYVLNICMNIHMYFLKDGNYDY